MQKETVPHMKAVILASWSWKDEGMALSWRRHAHLFPVRSINMKELKVLPPMPNRVTYHYLYRKPLDVMKRGVVLLSTFLFRPVFIAFECVSMYLLNG